MTLLSVIGSGYGDEGKGLAVDAITAHHLRHGEVTVVRVNGGAQAGHTVQTPDGNRHVFHQFGAGSLAGARTHWASRFVTSPMFFSSEKADLNALGARTDAITADPRVMITTPWDIMINQALEQKRGNDRHGSCGMGFGETIERNENGFKITLADIGKADFRDNLNFIRTSWFPRRMEQLGLDPDEFSRLALDDGIMNRFIADATDMLGNVEIVDDLYMRADRFGQIITEGAQGLALDMDIGDFPHVTRSNTGMKNVADFAREAGFYHVHATYMTRAYATRHGAGPFPEEEDIREWIDFNDPTNAPNAWQGAIRTGVLDGDGLISRIQRDEEISDVSDIKFTRSIGVSCLDQIIGPPKLIMRGQTVEVERIPYELCQEYGFDLDIRSVGPSRDSVLYSGSNFLENRIPSP